MKKNEKTNRSVKCTWVHNLDCHYKHCQICPYCKEYIKVMRNSLTSLQLVYVQYKMKDYIEVHKK